jgi:hypothetical protein
VVAENDTASDVNDDDDDDDDDEVIHVLFHLRGSRVSIQEVGL